MRYVSFSLFGDHQKYSDGAIQNARKMELFYPGWQAIFYCDASVPKSILQELRNLGAKVIEVQEPGGQIATLWRFRAALLDDAQHVLFRDCDSLPSLREASSVERWIDSKAAFHTIRDHPNHFWLTPAGMSGVHAPDVRGSFEKLVSVDWGTGFYGIDALFLERVFLDLPASQRMVDDSIRFSFGRNDFARSRDGLSYVGEVLFPDGYEDLGARKFLQRFLSSRFFRLKVRLRNKYLRLRDKLFLYRQLRAG